MLTSPMLAIFLEWISDNGLFVHYHALDPLYWSLVDIMDSILCRLNDAHFTQHHIPLKADLTALLRANLPETTSLFCQYNYPDLAAEKRRPFLNEFITMLERSDD